MQWFWCGVVLAAIIAIGQILVRVLELRSK